MSLRRSVGRLTSPVFVPLRRLVVWMDDRFGTCDHRLVLEPRACSLDLPESAPARISELEVRLSEDRADSPPEHRHLV